MPPAPPSCSPGPEMQHVLAKATEKLTQQEILERWPGEAGPPERSTLAR